MNGKRSLAALCALGLTAAVPARAKGSCTDTANLLLDACNADVQSNALVQKAVCINARGIGVFLEIENEGEIVQLVNCNFDQRCVNLPRPEASDHNARIGLRRGR